MSGNGTGAGTITIGGDLVVDRLGYGAMRITGKSAWGLPPDPKSAIALLRRVVESGVTLIDTADSYGPDTSEELIAEALHPYPAGLAIATKGGLVRPAPERWDRNGRPEHLRQACEASLRRLRLDRIDLYQLHAIDPKVPLADSLGALIDLKRQGKIRHIGVSNFSVAELAQARRLTEIVSVQNRYNLEDRSSDAVVDRCATDGLAFLPWFPLAAGQLARKGKALDQVARRLGAPRAQVALAWLLRRSPCMLPIPGTASLAHFEENLAAGRLRLGEEEFAALSRA